MRTIGKHLVMTIRLPMGIMARIDGQAEKEKVTRSDVVRELLEKHLPAAPPEKPEESEVESWES